MRPSRRAIPILLLAAGLLVSPAALAQDSGDEPATGIDRERLVELVEEIVEDASREGRNRMAAAPVEDLPEARRIARTLRSRVISVDFDGTPLREALRAIGEFTGLNLVASPEVREMAGADELAVTLRLREVRALDVLEHVLLQAGEELVYTVKHSVLWIARESELDPPRYLHVHSVEDLVRPRPDFPAPRLGLEGLVDDR